MRATLNSMPLPCRERPWARATVAEFWGGYRKQLGLKRNNDLTVTLAFATRVPAQRDETRDDHRWPSPEFTTEIRSRVAINDQLSRLIIVCSAD
ncbi:MAG: hypothetical protein ACI8XZ_003595 [Gammaproteobacteria bacterium]|jgi:hypothetical protein